MVRIFSKIHLKTSALVLASTASFLLQADPQLGKDSLDDVIEAMTLEEKVKLVRGTGMNIPGFSTPTVGMVEDKVPGAAGTTYPIERLGIPSIVLADGPAGVRIAPTREGDDNTYYATAFPIASLLASSWDTELTYAVGRAMGNETLEYGVDILLAPALNIHRYPLGGRNFEYYSEDPMLSGLMTTAMVRGIQSQGVGTSIKHFVANNHEWNRKGINVKVQEEALREIFLKGFEIAVEQSQPWTVMSSYNKVNGTHASESHKLLTEVLREQWGFKGFVMTDWFGGEDAVAQMVAGNDLLMPGYDMQHEAIQQAVKAGQLDARILDQNVENILKIVLRSPTFKGYDYSNQPDLAKHAEIARAAAAEGMVLLKNNANVLPLAANKGSIAVFGNYSFDMVTGGTGSGDVNEAYTVSLPDGLINAGFKFDAQLAKQYREYLSAEKSKRPELVGIEKFLPQEPIAEKQLDEASIAAAVKNNALALITIGRSSGEFSDRKAENDFYLSDNEQALLTRVSKAFKKANKPVIVVMNIGGVIEMESWKDKADAILLAWQPGQEAGNAIADVVSGKVNPSGKLPTTFARRLESYPASTNFPGVVTDPDAKPDMMGYVPAEVTYLDGTDIGYRYFQKAPEKVVYPFGYGLSYTSFSFAELTARVAGGDGKLGVKVTNTGDKAGKQVAQIYASNQSAEGAVSTLKTFAKTRLLQPGESQLFQLTVPLEDLAEYDSASKQWKLTAGQYRIDLASSIQSVESSTTVAVNQTQYFAL